jgi:Ser/Thr protein kinase RdoA (MazF antagonist)
MEQAIRDRYNEAIRAELGRRYGLAEEDLALLDGFESFIFAARGAERPFILRLSHELRRSAAHTLGEIDWLNFLAARGAGVARALPSPRGLFVERIPDGQGGAFLATAFARAAGGPPWENGRSGPALYAQYGRLLGRLHALTQEYTPGNPAWRRPAWDDPDNLIDIAKWLPAADRDMLPLFADVLAHLRALPTPPDAWGLIHQDAHTGNFFATDDLRLTLFDFDDCVYGHFVYDIAMVLFYSITNREQEAARLLDAAAADGPPGKDGLLETWAHLFWSAFWPAYQAENRLDPAWLAELPWFFKLREIELYAVIHRSMSAAEIAASPWTSGFMNGRRARILNQTPYSSLNFAA